MIMTGQHDTGVRRRDGASTYTVGYLVGSLANGSINRKLQGRSNDSRLKS